MSNYSTLKTIDEELGRPNAFALSVSTAESYQYLYGEARTAMFREFPEMHARFDLFDLTKGIDAEAERIGDSLSFANEADRKNFKDSFKKDYAKSSDGHMFAFRDSQNKYFGVAVGWPYGRFNNGAITKAFVHEASHGADLILNSATFDQQFSLGREALAEDTAIKVVSENGVGKRLWDEGSAMYAGRGELIAHAGPPYDRYSGTSYLQSMTSYKPKSNAFDGTIKGWREAFDEVHALRDNNFDPNQQMGFEILQRGIRNIATKQPFYNNPAMLNKWHGVVGDLPEYKSVIAAQKAATDHTSFSYAQPSITPDVFTDSLKKIWTTFAKNRDPQMKGPLLELLRTYRSVGIETMPQGVLKNAEHELVKDRIITADMPGRVGNRFSVDAPHPHLATPQTHP